jgi:hypothetical protein
MVAAIAEAVIGPKPEWSSAGGPFHPAGQVCDAAIEPSNRFVEVAQLHHQRRQRLTHFKRDGLVADLDQPHEFAGVSGALRRITPTSVKWPRSPLSSCVRCETNISRVL